MPYSPLMRPIVPPPVLGLAAGAALWGVARAVPGWNVGFAGQEAVAGAMAAVGLAIELAAILAFRRARTTVNPLRPHNASLVVAGGPYRFSRNPMYLGLLAVLAGWAVWLGNPLGAAVLAAFVGAVTVLQIRPEEAALAAKFGEGYAAYCRRVRRWL